jgi:hypothetical protein
MVTKHRYIYISAIMLLGFGLYGVAYVMMMTTWMAYDDEGYLLMTIRQFLNGQALYDQVYTQYGPWSYLYHLLLRLPFSEPMGHMFGRELTALHWVLCAGASGAITYRIAPAHKSVLGVFTTFSVFSFLWQMTLEPNHPGSLISITLAVSALGGIWAIQTNRLNAFAIIIGATSAVLLLTKINVGLLFVCGTGILVLRMTDWGQTSNIWSEVIAGIGLLALPWILMKQALHEPAYLYFALQFTIAAGAWWWITPRNRLSRTLKPQIWATAFAVWSLVSLIIVAWVMLRGTSLDGLVQGVLIGPLSHAVNFRIPLQYSYLSGIITALTMVTIGRAGWDLRRRGELGKSTRVVVITLRLALIPYLVLHVREWSSYPSILLFGGVCLSLLPIFLVPLRIDQLVQTPNKREYPYFWLVSIALVQVLHAFPIAGSQIGWGMFLTLPIFSLGLAEAARELNSLHRWLPRLTIIGLMGISSIQVASMARTASFSYSNSTPLSFSGAEGIRLDEASRITIENLALNAKIHADVLFSRPGMFSFNLWSGVPTPTERNATQWNWLLSNSDQWDIVQRLKNAPRSLIITHPPSEEFLSSIGLKMDGQLQNYISNQYEPWLELGDFVVLAPINSSQAPIGLVKLAPPTLSIPTNSHSFVFWQTNVWLEGIPDSIRLDSPPWNLNLPAKVINARLQKITVEGQLIGPSIPLPLTSDVQGLFRLEFEAEASAQIVDYTHQKLVIINTSGTALAESLFQ